MFYSTLAEQVCSFLTDKQNEADVNGTEQYRSKLKVKARKCCSKKGKSEMFAGPLLRVRELRIMAMFGYDNSIVRKKLVVYYGSVRR